MTSKPSYAELEVEIVKLHLKIATLLDHKDQIINNMKPCPDGTDRLVINRIDMPYSTFKNFKDDK